MQPINIRTLAATGLICAAFALTACGGGSGSKTTTGTIAPGSKASDVPRVTTNAPELDQPLNTALSGDNIEMARLTGYQTLPCSQQGAFGAPPCRENEANGTAVEVFPLRHCDTDRWIRPEDVPDAYAAGVAGTNVKLDGVYVPAAGAVHYDAQYIGVLSTGKHDNGAGAGTGFYFHAGRIVGLEDDCGDIATLLAPARVATFVVQPSIAAVGATAVATR